MQILDFEASGLDQASYPIEIGLYDDHDSSNHIDVLIKPHPNWVYWNETAETIHNIPRKKIEEEGLPIDEVIDIIEARMREVVYSDAPEFEFFWLDRLYEAVGRECPFKVKHVNTLLDLSEWGMFERLQQQNEIPHRAFEDAKLIASNIKKVIDSVFNTPYY